MWAGTECRRRMGLITTVWLRSKPRGTTSGSTRTSPRRLALSRRRIKAKAETVTTLEHGLWRGWLSAWRPIAGHGSLRYGRYRLEESLTFRVSLKVFAPGCLGDERQDSRPRLGRLSRLASRQHTCATDYAPARRRDALRRRSSRLVSRRTC